MKIRPKSVAIFVGLALVISVGVYKSVSSSKNRDLIAGINEFKSGNWEMAHKLIEPQAENSRHAQEYMGRFYAYGLFVEEDEKAARRWFTLASRTNEQIVNFALTVSREFDEPGGLAPVNVNKSKSWLEFANSINE